MGKDGKGACVSKEGSEVVQRSDTQKENSYKSLVHALGKRGVRRGRNISNAFNKGGGSRKE